MFGHWERDYYIECPDLQKGKYFAFVEMDWHESVKPSEYIFSLTTYGRGTTHISDETEKYDKTEFLKKVFISKLDYSKQGLICTNMEAEGAPDIKRYL